jgi:hypothetical protein
MRFCKGHGILLHLTEKKLVYYQQILELVHILLKIPSLFLSFFINSEAVFER